MNNDTKSPELEEQQQTDAFPDTCTATLTSKCVKLKHADNEAHRDYTGRTWQEVHSKTAPVAGEKREGMQLPPCRYTEDEYERTAKELSNHGSRFERALRYARERQLMDALRRATEAEGQLAEALAKVSRLSEDILALEQNMQGAAKVYEASVRAYKDRIAELEAELARKQ